MEGWFVLNINLSRLKKSIERMNKIGETSGGGVSRLALSSEDKEARDLFVAWMKESGLTVCFDDLGNIYGKRRGLNDSLKPIVVGSHLDSVPNGGKFDGILGVMCALEVIRTLNENQISTLRPIKIVDFTNEEGARFEPAMLGSGVLSGDFDIEFMYTRADKYGNKLQSELESIGYLGKRTERLTEAEAYIELHIEQGPVLDFEGIPIGAVEGIMGMSWFNVTVIGEADHAGPTPMSMRKDALCAAAKMILAIRDVADVLKGDAVTTVGKIEAQPGIVNAIPGVVRFSTDIRHVDNHKRNVGIQLIKERLNQIAVEEQVIVEMKEIWSIDTTVFSKEIVDLIVEAANYNDYPVRRIVSGAGHDAKYMNSLFPTAMIFVPSIEGKSHCEIENTNWSDIEMGANVLLRVVANLSNKR